MGMLWPEKDEDQARHLVSAAVYEIRKELGEDALITRGDDLLLDPAAVPTDLDDFLAAIEQGDPDRAATLYTGPFLDGFFLGGSPAFDQWMEEERESHARAFRGALAEVADRLEASGDLSAAAAAWRRLAAEDRYDTRVAIRLLRVLDAAGNRAAALQFARIHEVLMRDEFGAEPAPEFTAAVAAIRDAPTTIPGPAPPARSAPATPDAPPPSMASPGEPPTPPPATAAAAGTRATESTAAEPVGREGGTGSMFRLLTVAALVLGAVAAGAVIQSRSAAPATAQATIAVLPFSYDGSADEAFADGLTEEIVGVLGAVEGVRVPVWSAAASLRGVDARSAAARLGVAHVLEGSVRREGEMLRIRVRLSDARGMQRWAERYDRPEGAVFQTQDDIARAVLSALEVELIPGAVQPLGGGTRDVVAFNHYVRGRHAWYRRTPDGFRQALIYFHAAVAQDQSYARAHAGLADTYNLLGAYDYGLLPPDSAFPKARLAAERALALAPRLAEAHAALAQTRFAYDRDWAGAEASFQEAIRLNPRYPEAHHWYSLFLIAAGREAEALRRAEEAVALDSVSPLTHANMGRHLYYRGDHAAAEAAFHRALALDPAAVTAHLGLGLVLVELGRADEAAARFAGVGDMISRPHPLSLALLGNIMARADRRDEARTALTRLHAARAEGVYVPPEYPALIHIALGELDQAVRGLEEAFLARSSAIAFMGIDPLTAPLRGHPDFERLARRAGVRLPDR